MPGESESVAALEVSRVKEEHIAYTVKVLHAASVILEADGTDLGIFLSVDTDGFERVHEFLPDIMDLDLDTEMAAIRKEMQ